MTTAGAEEPEGPPYTPWGAVRLGTGVRETAQHHRENSSVSALLPGAPLGAEERTHHTGHSSCTDRRSRNRPRPGVPAAE